MRGGIDVVGTIIAGGTVVAVAMMLYGSWFGGTIASLDATVAAVWVFAATFVAVGVTHGVTSRPDLALGHGGAGAGLVIVLIADTGPQVAIGLLVLFLAGAYVVVITLRDRRKAREAMADVAPD